MSENSIAMSPETREYVDQFISAKRELKNIEAKIQELVYVLLPEIEALGTLTIGDATIYRVDARDRRTLNKHDLISILTSRFGESMATQIVDDATRLSNASMPTVAIRFKDQPQENSSNESTPN